MLKKLLLPLCILFFSSQISQALPPNLSTDLSALELPERFKIELYADSVPGARSMTLSESGTLFVGTRSQGQVYALIDSDKNNRADKVITIASGLNSPNGVAFRDGALYVAEISRILRFDKIEQNLNTPPQPKVINATLPSEAHHGWKFIRFGPDGMLYVPIGAPCNICLSKDPRFASISRMRADGSAFEIFAHGVRNTVGFDWHPLTKQLWFTDNGRDMLGDDIPPDELNLASKPGLHFGYPFCHASGITDPEFGKNKNCSEFTPPQKELGAHVAALGMRFYNAKMFPEKYHNQIFIAEHGSWNRSSKVGYRVMLAVLNGHKVVDYQPFATGWLSQGKVTGRPVDLEIMPDGSLLVSDDHAGAIYRISYTPT